jgi:hypothetical protein
MTQQQLPSCVIWLDTVFKIARCHVRGEPRSAKAAETKAGQRPVPPMTTLAQLGFLLPWQSVRLL